MIGWASQRRRAEILPSGGKPRVPAGARIYAIGDVHGRLDLFTALLALVRADHDARPAARVTIIVLGDIVDRGTETAALLALCHAATVHSPNFVVLKGNHEEMMTHALRGDLEVMQAWLRHGGDATLSSFDAPSELIATGACDALRVAAIARIPVHLLEWLDALPLYRSAGDYLFVHAGIRPKTPLTSQSSDDLLWIRDDFLESNEDHDAIVVHGHSIVATAQIHRNRIGIDTGAYRTGRLTALVLDGDERHLLCTGPAATSRGPVMFE